MTLDRRLPAVYVDLEDRSLATEEIQTGRSGYVVILSDRGPHNKIVELNSRQSLYDLFGKPDFTKYGQGHYLADQHLKSSNRLFVCRPAMMEPFGDATLEDCMAISNTSIGYNEAGVEQKEIKGTFVFTNGSNVVTFQDGDIEQHSTKISDWIGKFIHPMEADKKYAQMVLSVDVLNRQIILQSPYEGPSSVFIDPADSATQLKVKFMFTEGSKIVTYEEGDLAKLGSGDVSDWIGKFIYNEAAGKAEARKIASIDTSLRAITLENPWSGPTTIVPDSADSAEEVNGQFTFTPGSNEVTFEEGDNDKYASSWINKYVFPGTQKEHAVKVTAVDPVEKKLTLETAFQGTLSSSAPLKIYELVTHPPEAYIKWYEVDPLTKEGDIYMFIKSFIKATENVRESATLDPLAEDTFWHFYAIGAGEPYNDYYLKGVRNTQFEKIYTDNNGETLFPYMFMDVAVYRRNEDNTSTLMEGPWTVSLVNRTHTGAIVRDIYTGMEIYLPTIINKNSKLIRAVEAKGITRLLTIRKGLEYPYAPDVKVRMGVLQLFTNNVFLEHGRNGCLFDETGNLNYISNNYYRALVAQAYNGSLKGVDNTIELILQSIYPWYNFDYVYCGAYGSMASNAARELVDIRQDCLLLSDTGHYVRTAEEDLELRATKFDWNTYNAALYVQFRKIEDKFTGKEFYISPVYHALDRHLHVDANYWIAEPVANIEKGAIGEAIELAYRPNLTKLGDLTDKEMNPVIVEPDGTYLITQFTTWKRLSILKRQHVIKFIHFCRKKIPTLLKDLLQRKASIYWINQAQERVNGFMNPFVDTGELDRYAAVTNYNCIVKFDEVRSELIVSLTIRPIRAIEKITVNIIVV